MPTQILQPPQTPSGQLVTTDGRTLPLVATHLVVNAGGGLARTRLLQRFANRYQEPLTVTYQLPLPADGAVAAFAFQIGDRRIEGEIDARRAARERFEQAIATGHSAALLEQDRTSLFQQAIGNIPPGAEITAELTVDQPLAFCHGGEWEYRFPTTVAPRYLGAEGRVADAHRLAVDVAQDPLAPRLQLELAIADRLIAGAMPTSPSHALRLDPTGSARVALLAEGGVRLDRDVVVRWRVGAADVGADLITARPAPDRLHSDVAYGLLTLVPPVVAARAVARDLTVLLDTSGSMGGLPLQQAKAVVGSLIESLDGEDQLQMIEFSDAPRPWQQKPLFASAKTRQQALKWLHGLQASGGTEMHTAVMESMRSLREHAQSQVLLVTDGLIGFEQEIVQALLQRLPRNCRFSVLGVGSAPNRSLTAACARAGRGVEVFAGIGEAPAAATLRLVAAMRAPIVVDLQLSGSALLGAAPAQLPDLFAGAPARLSLRLCPDGGSLLVCGTTATGPFVRELQVPATPAASGRQEVVTRCGREQVEDLEMRVAAGSAVAECEQQIESLGLRFQLATRFTSWIAVSSEPTVDPQAPMRRERIAHDLPYGMSIEGLGLRQVMPAAVMCVGKEAMGQAMVSEFAAPAQAGLRKKSLWSGLAPAPRPAAAGAPRTPRIAILVFQHQDCLRLELEADGSAWDLPEEVLLHWRDGTVLTVRIDRQHSTRSGQVPMGARIALQLTLPATARADAPAAITLHGAFVAIAASHR